MEAVLQAVPANVAIPPAGGSLRLPAGSGTSQPAAAPTDVFAGIVQEILERTAPEGKSGALQPLQSGTARRASNGSAASLSGASSQVQTQVSSATDSGANAGLVLNLIASIAPQEVPAPETAGNPPPVNERHSSSAPASDTASPATGPQPISMSAGAAAQDANPIPDSPAQLAAPVVSAATSSFDLVGVLAQNDGSQGCPSAPKVQVLANIASTERQDATKALVPGPQNLSAIVNPFTAILKQVELVQNSGPGASPAIVSVTSKTVPAPLPAAGAGQRLQMALASSAPVAPPVVHQPQVAADSLKDVAARVSEKTVPEAIHGAQGRSGSRNDSSPDGNGASANTLSSSTTADLAKQQSGAFSQELAAIKDAAIQAGNAVQISHTATPTLNATESAANAAQTPAPTKAAAPAQPTPPGDVPDLSATRSANDAQLTHSANHSDMRIAMQTDQLGAIELHARVAGDQLGAAITVEKRDAHSILVAELPALQQALSEKQLHVAQLSLLQGSLHSTAGDTGAQHQQQERARHVQQVGMPFVVAPFTATIAGNGEQSLMFDSSGRLSVRA